ncbi:hypothetical protein HYQ45_004785 [Verticillium longisporum]|uniref:Uncharacterized protein n=1 Tax=Verticillium longisporum TaxID=100787 RepID=A0A8I2ZS35_VERLO|nr:hypothetical protein HYQ45_004785 [Verticillium longisporum]
MGVASGSMGALSHHDTATGPSSTPGPMMSGTARSLMEPTSLSLTARREAIATFCIWDATTSYENSGECALSCMYLVTSTQVPAILLPQIDGASGRRYGSDENSGFTNHNEMSKALTKDEVP